MATWLAIDMTYLCHRAFHAMGKLSWGGVRTGVVYGVLKDIISLQDRFGTSKLALCFDSRQSLRKQVYAGYKQHRSESFERLGDEEKQAYGELRRQIKALGTELLPTIGFRNIFIQTGYEADDLVAGVCLAVSDKDEVIVVGADHDFYQLISRRVSVWHPQVRQLVTLRGFRRRYGIEPERWPDVKAIAGCSTDGVEGVRGVGEVTAIKFLNGTLKSMSKAFRNIVNQDHLWRRNLPIVTIPYPGTRRLALVEDEVSEGGWRKVMSSLGIRSLRVGGVNYEGDNRD